MSEQLKDLIEGQVETAGNCLGRVEEEFSATGKFDSASLIMFCGGLFQVVQNLQNEIEELKERVRDLEPQTALGLLGEVAKKMHAPVAMGENLSDEEYERRKKK